MNTHQKRTLQAFRRIQGWLTAHPDLGGTPQSRPQLVSAGTAQKTITTTATTTGAAESVSVAGVAQQITALNTVVSDLTATAAEQEAQDRAAKGSAAEIVRLRDELVRHQMRHIAIIAETAIPDVVRMTVALRRPGYKDAEGIIASADAMANAAGQYKDVLVQRGLPADFVDQLRGVSAAFKKAVDSRGSSVGLRHHARESLKDVIERGKRVVDALSVLIARRYRGDSATLAEWTQVKHVVLVGVAATADAVAVKTAPSAVKTVPAAVEPARQAVNAAAA